MLQKPIILNKEQTKKNMIYVPNNKTFKDVHTKNRMTENRDDWKVMVLLTRQVLRIQILK